MAIKAQSFLKAALLVAAGAGLSGCVYDVGLGFASDGYYDDAYGCDPYGGYDAYYNCDYGQAFSNIGFGGGWYDNYYYPGYGIFLFDTFGRRYPMREQYRRYWGERRHNWYREHRGRDWDRSRYDGRDRGYKDNARSERSASPDRQGGWMRDRGDDRRDGRRNGNDQWRGGDQWRSGRGGGVNAIPMPMPGAVEPSGRGRSQDYGLGRHDRRGERSADAAAQSPARMQQDSSAEFSSTARTAPPSRAERPPLPPRRGRDEGDNVRVD